MFPIDVVGRRGHGGIDRRVWSLVTVTSNRKAVQEPYRSHTKAMQKLYKGGAGAKKYLLSIIPVARRVQIDLPEWTVAYRSHPGVIALPEPRV